MRDREEGITSVQILPISLEKVNAQFWGSALERSASFLPEPVFCLTVLGNASFRSHMIMYSVSKQALLISSQPQVKVEKRGSFS